MKNKSLLLNSLAVAFGGFIGGSLRAIMMMLANSSHFPWETIIVNLSGTFISALLVILLGKLTKLKQITADFGHGWYFRCLYNLLNCTSRYQSIINFAS